MQDQETDMKEKIPLGVRFIIYSFLEWKDLAGKATKVSKLDREKMIGNKLLD